MLRHRIQRAPIPEPLNLRIIIRMCQLRLPRLAILRMHSQGDRFADGKFSRHDVEVVVGVDLVVVGGVGESEREHALFFEVGFMLDGIG